MLQAHATTLASKIPTFSDYWAAGLAVLPISEQGFPSFKWGEYATIKKPTADQLFEWSLDPMSGYALICGEVSGVVCVDIDVATDAQIGRIKAALGATPCAKVGSKGVSLFYKYNGEQNSNFTKDGVLHVEILANKRLTTIPPSKHRSKEGVFYKWIGKSLLDGLSELPLLPANYAEKINNIFLISPKPEPIYRRESYDNDPDFDEVVKALNYCDPNCSNDEWVQIGMAVRSVLGDAGLYEFDKWSQGGSSYDAKTIRSRWKSFNSRSITFGTLVYYAKQGGYRPIQNEHKITQTIDPKEYTKLRLEHEARKLEESEEIPELVTAAPRLIRLLTEWLYKSAPHPQPMLSLGAALTTIGFIMGKDFICQGSGIKANLYSVCIAGSQEGKQEIVSRCRTVMKEFDLMKSYQTAWTSGAAIENVMEQTDGQVFYITDEMGILMSQLVGKHTSANQQEAVSILLRLYTENYYKGKGYAKSAEQKPVEIANPFVSICGFTQREPFFEAMSSMQAHTGVLNRMCLFKAPDIRPKYNIHNTYADRYNLPPDLKAALQVLHDSLPQYKVGKAYVSQAKEVPFTEEARQLLQEIIIKTDERFRKSQLDGDNIHLFIGRSPEVIQKVALIGSCGGIIDKSTLLWAKSVVDYTVGLMITYSKDIVDTDYDRKKNKTIEFIAKRGGYITKTIFTENCKIFSNRREREEIVMDLIDAGRLEVATESGNSKPVTVYKIPKA